MQATPWVGGRCGGLSLGRRGGRTAGVRASMLSAPRSLPSQRQSRDGGGERCVSSPPPPGTPGQGKGRGGVSLAVGGCLGGCPLAAPTSANRGTQAAGCAWTHTVAGAWAAHPFPAGERNGVSAKAPQTTVYFHLSTAPPGTQCSPRGLGGPGTPQRLPPAPPPRLKVSTDRSFRRTSTDIFILKNSAKAQHLYK